MTLLFFDGFETYGATATGADGMEDVYNLHSTSTPTVTIIASARIADGSAIRIDGIGPNADLTPALGPQLHLTGFSSEDDWVFGAAFRAPGGLALSPRIRPLFEIRDSDSDSMVELRVDYAGDLTLDRHDTINSTQTINTAVGAFTGTDWNYVELKVKFHSSAGSYDVRVNEVSVMSGTGAKTSASSETRPSHLRFGHIEGQFLDVDDFYVLDDTGTINNDFLGNVRVQRLLPDGLTATEDFTPSTGTTNWDLVNELTESGDTGYVESNTVGDRDLYEYENLPLATDTIFAVIAKPVVRKSDAGSRTYKLLCSSGIFEAEIGTLYPAGTYVRQAKIFETDPATGNLWEEAGINSAKFGVEIVS